MAASINRRVSFLPERRVIGRSTISVTHRRTAPIKDIAPSEPTLTVYDRAHFATYLRLLDAAAEGAPWREACRIVLGIDPVLEPERAWRAHETHLARARWMTRHGYRQLLANG
jgi:hypothetical protein